MLETNRGYLVECLTEDSLRLHGFLQVPEGKSLETTTLWILVHGVASNFYGASLLASIAERLVQLGHAALRINTRGHDPVSYLSGPVGIHRGGAAYETIGEATLDLEAWVGYAHSLRVARVGMLGHSLGAVKSVCYLKEKSSQVDRLVAISPPRLNLNAFEMESETGFALSMEEAMQAVESGQPEKLLKVRYPFPMLVSASTYVDKYGSRGSYDVMELAPKVVVPSLWVYGGMEVQERKVSFLQADEKMREIAMKGNRMTVVTIPNGDHNYTRVRPELLEQLGQWVLSHPSA